LEIIKDLCPYLTAKDDDKVLLFNEDQLKAIDACSDLKTMFRENLRRCWRWDDFLLLEKIIQIIDSDVCKSLLSQYQQALDYKMKLQVIYDHCKQEKENLPEGYSAMVAIIKGKNFCNITLEEYSQLKEFTSKYCGIDSWFLPPFVKASSHSSVLLKWFVPLMAVSYMVKMATENIDVFVKENFVYLKISSVVVLDTRDNVSLQNNI